MKMKYIILIALLILILVVIIGIVIGEQTNVKKFSVDNEKIDSKLKIVQLTDLHSLNNEQIWNEIVSKTNALNPDVIFLTGDIIDDPTDNLSIKMLQKLKADEIFYISGNHEFDYGDEFYEKTKKSLQAIGVVVLDNESTTYQQKYNIIGIKDFYGASFGPMSPELNQIYVDEINSVTSDNVDPDKVNILLMHRPQYFKDINLKNIDYVFSGHVHGGQWQFPFSLFALLGPDQGLFPTYFEGTYTQDNSTLFVSPGLERKYSIPRLYNAREIYYIEIY